MSRHYPAGAVLAIALALVGLYAGAGCYKCKTPDCSELPCPGGNPGPGCDGVVETVSEAGRRD